MLRRCRARPFPQAGPAHGKAEPHCGLPQCLAHPAAHTPAARSQGQALQIEQPQLFNALMVEWLDWV
jgi:hypothetical protein